MGLFLLIVAGLFVYGLSSGFLDLHEVALWERVVAWVVALSGIVAGLWSFHEAREHRTVIDASRREVTIDRRAPFHSARQHIRLDDVAGVEVTHASDSAGAPLYGLSLVLKSGARAQLAPRLYPRRATCDRPAAAIASFLAKCL